MVLSVKNVTSMCVLLAVFFLAGCDGQRTMGSDNAVAIEMEGEGRVYHNDPRVRIDDSYGDVSFDEIKGEGSNGDFYAKSILGVLYLSGSEKYGVVRDPKKGRSLLESSWRSGVVDAGFVLYEIYASGNGVENNPEIALFYLSSSAEEGYIKSQRILGMDYYGWSTYDLVETDYIKARDWLEKAAEQGDKYSATGLVEIYSSGKGGVADEDMAFKWLSRIPSMQYGNMLIGFDLLGKYYEEGIGTEVDLVQAYKYYDLQGTAGISEKQRILPLMTPEQVDEAVEMSHDWQIEHNISLPNSEGYRYR